VEAFGLTSAQLNILTVTYYADVGWISEDRIDYPLPLSEIKTLVNADLLYITYMVREVSAVHSMGDGGLVNFVSDPVSSHCAAAITDKGKELVELMNLSRRADACIAEGDIYSICSFVNSLDIKDLPEFLSHSHQQLREEASKRLDDCLKDIPSEVLADLLTDSDSIIRDTANSILVHSIGVEE